MKLLSYLLVLLVYFSLVKRFKNCFPVGVVSSLFKTAQGVYIARSLRMLDNTALFSVKTFFKKILVKKLAHYIAIKILVFTVKPPS